MKLRETIILAGGLGTRLRSELPDLPKCLAPVAGRPFLAWLIEELVREGIRRFIFSLGYRHEAVSSFLRDNYPDLDQVHVVEPAPLGTGGAIRLAMKQAQSDRVLICNGDTMFRVHLDELAARHEAMKADVTMALKPMHDFDRYGVVSLNEGNRIMGFQEKKWAEAGLINGGVYLLGKKRFDSISFPDIFSFETDYLAAYSDKHLFAGLVASGFFIDIGIPDDYHRVQEALPEEVARRNGPGFRLETVGSDWTLFLDRDGVINQQIEGDYIRSWSEFHFNKGVQEAIALLSRRFGRIIVVTNQKGIGRGLMTPEDLADIHQRMLAQIEVAGGRIDRIYHASDTDALSPMRKPQPGMGLRALHDFPDIEPKKALMVGNTIPDMLFGRNLGVSTVFLTTTAVAPTPPHPAIDLIFPDLPALAKAL